MVNAPLTPAHAGDWAQRLARLGRALDLWGGQAASQGRGGRDQCTSPRLARLRPTIAARVELWALNAAVG
ncbi:MAG: BTAD domain-containing putative transcriptional regulator [Alphaproteobacteria bacterium]